MIEKTLSIMPYYGGKAKMAKFISDKLNYNCSTYVELFGGGCRVLLNKPRHNNEIYIDMSEGLTTLISVLSDKKLAGEFIQKLYYETEYSEEEFKKAKKDFDICEMTISKYMYKIAEKKYEQFLKDIGYIKKGKKINISKVLVNDKATKQILKLSKEYDNHKALKEISELDEFNPNILEQYHAGESMRVHGFDISEIDLAVATYITYAQSRDGMGKHWSKGRSDKQYKKKIENLLLCAERLQGVCVLKNDAMSMVGCFEELKNTIVDLKDRENIMLCADPSYISTEDEKKLLEGIDYINIDIEKQSLSDEIVKIKRKTPSNLGKVYVESFEYKEHEEFLRYIYKSKTSIMISNYDLVLYNKYLNEKTGWKKFEFDTVTNVGNSKGRKRKEIIWINY